MKVRPIGDVAPDSLFQRSDLEVWDCYYSEPRKRPLPAIEFLDVSQHAAMPGAVVMFCGLDSRRGFWQKLPETYGYWRTRAHGWCPACRRLADPR